MPFWQLVLCFLGSHIVSGNNKDNLCLNSWRRGEWLWWWSGWFVPLVLQDWSVWKAESDNTAKIFVVLDECPDIPSARYPVSVLLKSVLFRPFFQCESPYLKEKELMWAFCAKWCGSSLFLILQRSGLALCKLYIGKIGTIQPDCWTPAICRIRCVTLHLLADTWVLEG